MQSGAEAWKDLWERANDAGVRFVMTEIEVAASLLESIPTTSDANERSRRMREALAAVDAAARCSRGIDFPNGDGQSIQNRIQQLRDELQRIPAVKGKPAVARFRLP